MGHLLNPISLRLGISRFWNSNWSFYFKNNYKYLLLNDYILLRYLKRLSIADNPIDKKLFSGRRVFSNYIILKKKEILIILMYIHDHTALKKLTNKINKFKYKINTLVYIAIKNSFFYKIINEKEFNIDKVIKIIKKKIYDLIFYYFFENLNKIVIEKYWINLRFLIKYHLNLLLNNCFKFIDIQFFLINRKNITSLLVGKYFAKRLAKNHIVTSIFTSVYRGLETISNIIGFKICISGRFSRKLRAEYKWVKLGPISFNTLSSPIDYCNIPVRSKYGIGNVKIWITQKSNYNNFLVKNILYSQKINKYILSKQIKNKNNIYFNYLIKINKYNKKKSNKYKFYKNV
jgi:hypothetical protein